MVSNRFYSLIKHSGKKKTYAGGKEMRVVMEVLAVLCVGGRLSSVLTSRSNNNQSIYVFITVTK
jgi:hypothetical protein